LKERFAVFIEYRKSLGEYGEGLQLTDFKEVIERLAVTKRTAGIHQEEIEHFAELVQKINDERYVKFKKRTVDRDAILD